MWLDLLWVFEPQTLPPLTLTSQACAWPLGHCAWQPLASFQGLQSCDEPIWDTLGGSPSPVGSSAIHHAVDEAECEGASADEEECEG